MELDLVEVNCCWKCGNLNHHRQDCSSIISNFESNRIKLLCKRIQREIKGSEKSKNLPMTAVTNIPLFVFEECISTHSDFYHATLLQIDELGLPGYEVEGLEKQKERHHILNMKLLEYKSKEGEDFAYLCKKKLEDTNYSATMMEQFEAKYANFKSLRHDAYERSNKLTMWSMNALSSARIFEKMDINLQTNIDQLSSLLGRPTFLLLQEGKNLMKNLEIWLGVLKREGRVLKNICKRESAIEVQKKIDRRHFRIKALQKRLDLAEVQLRSLDLESTKEKVKKELAEQMDQETQVRLNKLLCTLCEENDKEWILKCGHMYCTLCIQGLQENRVTEGIPVFDDHGIELGNYSVALPKECAFCRGSLEPIIRMFF